jgi:hypothetical protein
MLSVMSNDLNCWSGDSGLAGAREEYHNLSGLSNHDFKDRSAAYFFDAPG